MSIWAFRHRDALLRVRRRDWDKLIDELARRGAGVRESGAFLLGRRGQDPRRVSRVVYLDDVDPNCLQGNIRFDGRAFSKLWDLCDREGLRLIGDVHTHPGRGVRQSPTDADNPMLARPGHVALIVPEFATAGAESPDVGVHRYRGRDGWDCWTGQQAAKQLFIARWL